MCFPDFDEAATGFESRLINPADLVDAVVTCPPVTAVNLDQPIVAGSFDFCGTAVPAFTVTQGDGLPRRVVLFSRDLRIDGALTFSGNAVPTFIAYGDITITAAVSVAAVGTTSGSGVAVPCFGTGAGGEANNGSGAGGGGGGGAQPGGSGGEVAGENNDRRAAGGAAFVGAAVVGGCPGGQGQKDRQDAGALAPGGGGSASVRRGEGEAA